MTKRGLQNRPTVLLNLVNDLVGSGTSHKDEKRRRPRLEALAQLLHEVIVNADIRQRTGDCAGGGTGQRANPKEWSEEQHAHQRPPETAPSGPGRRHVDSLMQLDLAVGILDSHHRIIQIDKVFLSVV